MIVWRSTGTERPWQTQCGLRICGGLRVFGKIGYPKGERPFPLVVFSHGFGASRVHDGNMPADFIEQHL